MRYIKVLPAPSNITTDNKYICSDYPKAGIYEYKQEGELTELILVPSIAAGIVAIGFYGESS